MIALSLIFQVLILSQTAQPTSIAGSFIRSQIIYQTTYTVSTSSQFINFQMEIFPYYSAVLLVAQLNNDSVPTDRASWVYTDPSKSVSFDFEGLVMGRDQYSWVQNPGINQTIYLKIINFGHPSAPSYKVTFTESDDWINYCTNGTSASTINYCETCPDDYLGVYCTISKKTLSADQELSIILPANSYHNIIPHSKIAPLLQLSYSNSVTVYLLDEAFDGQYAGIVNYFPPQFGKGRYKFNSKGFTQISINYNFDLLVGVFNTNPFPVDFSISFSEYISMDLSLIIGISCTVFVAVIIGVICIVRKCHNSRIQSLSRGAYIPLTLLEINFYFPAVLFKTIHDNNQQICSESKLEENDSQSSIQCIICMSDMKQYDYVRVCYCKHIFHSQCLIQWFNKKPNCPTCRQDFSKRSTVYLYNMLEEQTGKDIQRSQIARQILGDISKPSFSSSVLHYVVRQH